MSVHEAMRHEAPWAVLVERATACYGEVTMQDIFKALAEQMETPEPPKAPDTTPFVLHLYGPDGMHLTTEVVHGATAINAAFRVMAARAGVRATGQQSVSSRTEYVNGQQWTVNRVRFVRADSTVTATYAVLYGTKESMLDEYPRHLRG